MVTTAKPTYTRRQRAMCWLNFTLDRWATRVDRRQRERKWAPAWLTFDWVEVAWLCGPLRAHIVVDDMCGRPEHRVCATCSTSTPNRPTVP